MASVINVQVFGLDESIYRSGYPMMSRTPSEEEFKTSVAYIKQARLDNRYDISHIKRAINLARAKGGGHDQFLTGITVTADVNVSNKCWVEAERYKFLNFISSMSTMHRASRLPIAECCNQYVEKATVRLIEQLQRDYNEIDDCNASAKHEAYLRLLYNLPSGFELTAGMITNYRCLKNMYAQRKNHSLKPDWGVVCEWIRTLPMAAELITGGM